MPNIPVEILIPDDMLIPGPEGPQGATGPQGPAGVTPDLSDIYARLDALEGNSNPDIDPPPPPSGDPYDLGQLPDFVSDIRWPEPPVIVQEVNVTSDSDWVNEDNTRYIVAAGVYTSKTINCNHCEFVLDDNAVINGSLTFAGHHIKWTGGQKIGNGTLQYMGANATGDLLIDNLHAITAISPGDVNNFSGQNGWERIAIINSTINSVNSCPTDCHALFIQPAWPADAAPFRGSDLILANVKFLSDAQNQRIQNVRNYVVVDSYFNADGRSTNGLRIHHAAENVYFRDNIVVGVNVFNGDVPLTNGLFENVIRYVGGPAEAWHGIGSLGVNLTIQNSQVHTTNNPGNPPPLFSASGTNPVTLPWDGSLPDHSGYGADH